VIVPGPNRPASPIAPEGTPAGGPQRIPFWASFALE
jgi:hypothetical protein